MQPKKTTPFIVKFAIMTLLTALVWVGFDVYRAFTQKPPPAVSAEILAPVDPTLDSATLEKLTNRVYFEKNQTPPSP
jgi:hypothetical protein